MRTFEIAPPENVTQELDRAPVDKLIDEAIAYLKDATVDTDDMALARMFIERGYSEDLSYWLVREAEVRNAPGTLPTGTVEPLI